MALSFYSIKNVALEAGANDFIILVVAKDFASFGVLHTVYSITMICFYFIHVFMMSAVLL
jgi:hypothetical protein